MAGGPMTVHDALRENWFWSGVFRDHATFIHANLGPDQDPLIRRALGFAQSLEKLHQEAATLAQQAGLTGPAGTYAYSGEPAEAPLAGLQGQELLRLERQAAELTQALLQSITALRSFKEELLAQKLDCKVKLGLGPSLIAHMIVEAEEAHRTLGPARTVAALPEPLQALHHHLVWLPDASGHAGVLHSNLDALEGSLLKTTRDFQHIFDGMHLKALELYTMLRVAPRMVGALRRLNRDAMAQIGVFRAFLAELREHLEDCEVLNVGLMPLLADHMLREELYYTEKLLALQGQD
jgi:hypothetical protein